MMRIARHRHFLMTMIALIGAISAAFSGFFGGRVFQHHWDQGDLSRWDFLFWSSGVALTFLVVALVCGAGFLMFVWLGRLNGRDASSNPTL